MRIRTIKPSFWSSATIASVSREARLVFIGLWNIADDEGRLLGGAKGLAGALFEHDDDVDGKRMSAWLDELEGRRLIERYSVKGVAHICVSGFGEHQKIDKRFPSRLPPPPDLVGESPRLLSDGSEGSWREVGGKSASEVGIRKSEVGSQKLECESAASPLKQLSPPAVVVPVEAEGEEPEVDPEPTALQRTERRESEAVVRSAARNGIAARSAAASAVYGRPQTVDALLALRVIETPDGRMQMAPDGGGKRLGDLWAANNKPLDGKGEPRRPTIAQVLERVWEYSLSKPWKVDGDGVGTRYLAWWSGILAADASKFRIAWERDGAGTAADPDRAAARRKYISLQATRDMPPFDTWYLDAWKRGRADEDIPEFNAADVTPSSQGSGSWPAGPSSGSTRPPIAAVIAAADAQRSAPEVAAGGFELMRKAQAAPRTLPLPTTEVSS